METQNDWQKVEVSIPHKLSIPAAWLRIKTAITAWRVTNTEKLFKVTEPTYRSYQGLGPCTFKFTYENFDYSGEVLVDIEKVVVRITVPILLIKTIRNRINEEGSKILHKAA